MVYSNNKYRTATILYHYYNDERLSPLYWVNMVKSKRFAPEREYRIDVPLTAKEDKAGGIKIHLGNLSNDVGVINNIDDFINVIMGFKDNQSTPITHITRAYSHINKKLSNKSIFAQLNYKKPSIFQNDK